MDFSPRSQFDAYLMKLIEYFIKLLLMRVTLAVLFVLSLSLFARGQTHELDSLKRRLYSLPQDTSLIHYGIQISEKLISLGNFTGAV